MSCRVAIIGGGPGGLMTAYQLQQEHAEPVELTLYEASGRLGGKVLTGRFSSADVPYEAGAAELYDYSAVGEDPLRELVEHLGLKTKPMSGAAIVLDDCVFETFDDVRRVYGDATWKALLEFDRRAKAWCSPEEYYESDATEGAPDPMALSTFESELAKVPDATARLLLRTMVHSDLATEPHRTSAAYGLQNYLMNDAPYMTLYTIAGGIGQLVDEVAARVTSEIRLRETVLRVERVRDERLRVVSRRDGDVITENYDYVVVALPNNYLTSITWAGEALARAVLKHHIHYDHPAHYLRVSLLFRTAFWRDQWKDAYMMLDAFGGCCVYDESSRNDCGEYGVLGWLLGGDAAVNASNLKDNELIELVLDSLPSFLQHGRASLVEGRVHRWIGAVNGLPGGTPLLDMVSRHVPEPAHPNLLYVGDYLFDSTLNGVLDSATYVSELVVESVQKRMSSSLHVAAS